MKWNASHCGAFILVWLLLFVLTLSAACSKQGSTAATGPSSAVTPNLLPAIQKNISLSASLNAVMTFVNSGTEFSFPSEFAVELIPIAWMDLIFNGRVEEAGPGEDVTYEVHGSVSRDGHWLESAYFSAQIIRTGSNTGNFFRVTLRSAPIVKILDGVSSDPGKLEQTGSEVQKYVAKIEYMDGPLVNGQISTRTTYLSTDWKNDSPGQAPVLKVQFSLESGGGTKTPSPGM